MPGTLGSAPLLTPWLGMQDIMQGATDFDILLVAGLFTIALAGVVLALYGSHFREQPAEHRTVVVRAPRPTQRMRRRRR